MARSSNQNMNRKTLLALQGEIYAGEASVLYPAFAEGKLCPPCRRHLHLASRTLFPFVVYSFSDIPDEVEENVPAIEDPLEHDFAAGSSTDSGMSNTKDNTDCGISNEASGMGKTNEKAARGINGTVNLGGSGGKGSRMDAVQELAWRYGRGGI